MPLHKLLQQAKVLGVCSDYAGCLLHAEERAVADHQVIKPYAETLEEEVVKVLHTAGFIFVDSVCAINREEEHLFPEVGLLLKNDLLKKLLLVWSLAHQVFCKIIGDSLDLDAVREAELCDVLALVPVDKAMYAGLLRLAWKSKEGLRLESRVVSPGSNQLLDLCRVDANHEIFLKIGP